MTPEQRANALRSLLEFRPEERLYGIVDGAQDLCLAMEAQRLYEQKIVSLFEGSMASAAASVAPYVVPIDPAGAYLRNWTGRWGGNAGILLIAKAETSVLRKHLRRIFVVRDTEGQEYFFRFYDPRVLRRFLPTCTLDQAKEFFGPVRLFLCEDSASAALLRFSIGPKAVDMKALRLEATGNGTNDLQYARNS